MICESTTPESPETNVAEARRILDGTTPENKEKPKLTPVTVEHSLEVIAELISEVEADDPPSHPTEPVIEPIRTQVYKHRFSIYRKTSAPAPGASVTQLKLFQSFAKCIKLIDHSLKVLPIRSDVNMYPLVTSDQIYSLEHVGISNYFKPFKRVQKTIAGDFHIQTKLSFDDFSSHPGINTWLMQHGYNIQLNGCQSSDMVRIGFLSRMRGFTLRNDFQTYIMSSQEWKDNPFHFRLYFDAISARGKLAHVLMVDVDRPSIDHSMKFFQDWFNGTAANSPNNIPYIFWPLYRKSYEEGDRARIIADHEYQVGHNSVVAVKGLQPLENVVKLVNGVYTTIRRLLLSIPAQGTVTGKLFIQVERQLSCDWLLCCFHTQDEDKVSARLCTLEDSLKKVIHPECHGTLFLNDIGLTFNGRIAPLIRGKSRLPRLEVPVQTAEYVSQSLQRLYSPTTKRQAVELQEMNEDNTEERPKTISVPRQAPSFSYATAINPHAAVISPNAATTIVTKPPEALHDSTIYDLQTTTKAHSNALVDLKECCASLMQTQQKLAQQMVDINSSINRKFDQMASSIDNLRLSPSRHSAKIHKDFHRSIPEEHMAS